MGPLDGVTPITVRVDGDLVAQFYPKTGVPMVALAIAYTDRLLAQLEPRGWARVGRWIRRA